MKTLKLVPLFLVTFLFCNNTAIAQEEDEYTEDEDYVEEEALTTTITGVYKGIEDKMYVFTYIDEDDEEVSISFANIASEAKKAYDFSSKKIIGKTFKIEYSQENVPDDDDPEILTNIKTIETLKLVVN